MNRRTLFLPILALSYDERFTEKNVIQEEMTPELRKKLVDMLSDSIPVIYAILEIRILKKNV